MQSIDEQLEDSIKNTEPWINRNSGSENDDNDDRSIDDILTDLDAGEKNDDDIFMVRLTT